MKTDLFQSCDHCWVFQICWHNECSTFTASSFRIWNSSTGIPSPPLALFIVMLPKAHLTSHSRMSGSGQDVYKSLVVGISVVPDGWPAHGSDSELRWIQISVLAWWMCACMLSRFSHVRLFTTLWTVAHQAPLSVGFSRQVYWSGLPCPPAGDLADPETELVFPVSPELAGRFFFYH